MRGPLMDRLAEKVALDDNGCLIFTGARTAGYGVIGVGGRADGLALAHRVTYEHAYGPIPYGLHIDHLCRVRACCNPEHLEAVTQGENNQRMWDAKPRPTHCIHGHEFTPENTYVWQATGQRQCRACGRDRYQAQKKVSA